MSVPKSHKTSSRTKRGRSHMALKQVKLSACPACKAPRQPHHACKECGNYAGRTVKK